MCLSIFAERRCPSSEHSQDQGPARGSEHQAVVANHQTSLQAAKDALAASQAELKEACPKLQKLETTKATFAASWANPDTAKAEAKAALEGEQKTSGTAMEDMFYHCWAYNQDANFSFLAANIWERLLVKFQARLDKEAPSEAGEGSGAAEQGETATSKGPTGGA